MRHEHTPMHLAGVGVGDVPELKVDLSLSQVESLQKWKEKQEAEQRKKAATLIQKYW